MVENDKPLMKWGGVGGRGDKEPFSWYVQYRSEIHELIISLRFLGIILRVLRLEVSLWAGGLVFYQVFLISPLQCRVEL